MVVFAWPSNDDGGDDDCDGSCEGDSEFGPPVCSSRIQFMKAVLLPTEGSAHFDRPRFVDPSLKSGVEFAPLFGDPSVKSDVEVSVSRSIFSRGLGTMQGCEYGWANP